MKQKGRGEQRENRLKGQTKKLEINRQKMEELKIRRVQPLVTQERKTLNVIISCTMSYQQLLPPSLYNICINCFVHGSFLVKTLLIKSVYLIPFLSINAFFKEMKSFAHLFFGTSRKSEMLNYVKLWLSWVSV